MILYSFPIAQNAVNKTASENFYRGLYVCICMHIFNMFSIYWSDTSLYSNVKGLNGSFKACRVHFLEQS